MKWIAIIVVVFVIFLFARCRPTYMLKYEPKDNKRALFSFKLQESDSDFQSLELITTIIKKKNEEPMYLQAFFKGKKKYAEKILTIDLKLFSKNTSTAIFDHEIHFKNSYTSSDHSFYYYSTYNIGELNYTGNLNKLIWPGDDNPEDRINNFYINKELLLNEYPQEVNAVIHVKWIGGEQEFSTVLILNEFKSQGKVRTNPFG